MSGHTPETWENPRFTAAPYSIWCGNTQIATTRWTQDDGSVSPECVPDDNEAKANATLAAAAPKRLKALQSIVASLVEHDDEGMIEHAEQMIAARAALAMMDRLEDYYRRHEVLIGPVDDAYSVEHKAARLAVAELIEAAAALCGAIEFRIDDPRNALRDRAVMALAGCGSAK